MAKQLPDQPNISQLRRQARDLQRAARSGESEAISRIRADHPSPPESFADFGLRDAQLTLAREYGFDGWHELSVEVGERMVDDRDLHRWFGVQLNNGVWQIIDEGTVNPDSPEDQRELLLYSAYASALHWRNAGTVANAARGEHLISRAAVVAGRPEVALHHARRCHQLVTENISEMEDWDIAFALEALARAEAANGVENAAETRLEAIHATEAVADDEDRQIVESELRREPWFGLI